ncbi:universal stress protein [Paenibacillus humicola]|uniref:universal stress protein n=1 Tax=Paenibacillus humicola TaxID=3110540 RepID=UPI00237A3F72|nr:universal stress protein [Paenibacillus humicola]
MLFHHVLAAFDGSKAAEKALATAVKLVECKQANRLTVVHVWSAPAMVMADALVTAPASIQRDWAEQAQLLLQEAGDKIVHLPYAHTELLEGRPGEAILDSAERNGCSLIVLGSRGLSPIREFVLGSVSHEVTVRAKVPVLIVK